MLPGSSVVTPSASCVCWVIPPLLLACFCAVPRSSLRCFKCNPRAGWLARAMHLLLTNWPKVFPIFASPLPAENRAFLSRIDTPIIFFFSTVWRGFFLKPAVEGRAPVPPTCLAALIGANFAPMHQRICLFRPSLHAHSYRRISTGRSRTAARAGKIVAPIEIPIATVVIQTPSKILG